MGNPLGAAVWNLESKTLGSCARSYPPPPQINVGLRARPRRFARLAMPCNIDFGGRGGPGTRKSSVLVDFDVDLNFSFSERHKNGHGAP